MCGVPEHHEHDKRQWTVSVCDACGKVFDGSCVCSGHAHWTDVNVVPVAALDDLRAENERLRHDPTARRLADVMRERDEARAERDGLRSIIAQAIEELTDWDFAWDEKVEDFIAAGRAALAVPAPKEER